jgi:hypothetical protein
MELLFAHGWWFSPGTSASSTTKSGCHNIAEILLKVALILKHQKSINQSSTILRATGKISLLLLTVLPS